MRCNKLNIVTNHQALTKSASVTTTDGLIQGNLDGVITRQPRPPTFSTAGLLDYIIELIVEEDEAFQLVDKGAFHRLLMFTRPSLSERDIPHRTKIHFGKHRGQGFIYLDTWTSDAQDPYLSVTGHYITAPEDQPQD